MARDEDALGGRDVFGGKDGVRDGTGGAARVPLTLSLLVLSSLLLEPRKFEAIKK